MTHRSPIPAEFGDGRMTDRSLLGRVTGSPLPVVGDGR